MKKILALIAARSGSQGLPGKNIKKINNTPLIGRAIQLAQQSAKKNELWQIVVSTDSPHYKKIAERFGAQVPFLRPAHLATASARLIDVVLHVVDFYENERFDAVVVISPTAPLTTPKDIHLGLRLFWRDGDSVVSVTDDTTHPSWYFHLTNGRLRQNTKSKIERRQRGQRRLVLNGAFLIAAPTWLKKHRQFFVSGKSHPLIMPKNRSLDIETAFDLDLARHLLARLQK